MKRIDLEIGGMTCAGCGEHVADALRSVDGARSVELDDWTDGRAAVTAHDNVDPEALETAVGEVGYAARVSSERSPKSDASSSPPDN